MDLSVVLPIFEAEGFIAERLARLIDALGTIDRSWEVIAVDDGSRDGTRGILESLAWDRVQVVSLATNRGKFGAIKEGMARARGRCRIFTDADLPYETDALAYFAGLVLDGGFHVIVGDRTLPGSVYRDELPLVRRTLTSLFTTCVRVFVAGGLHDTQCGLKAVRGDVADRLFPLLREEGFAGDVEMLYVALKYNLAIRRVPVRLVNQGPSSVRALRDGRRMASALLRLRGRHRRGDYEDAILARIAAQDYWAPKEPT